MSPARIEARASLAAREWKHDPRAYCAVPRYEVVTPHQGDVLSAIARFKRDWDENPSDYDIRMLTGILNGTLWATLYQLSTKRLVRIGRGQVRTLRLSGAPFVVA